MPNVTLAFVLLPPSIVTYLRYLGLLHLGESSYYICGNNWAFLKLCALNIGYCHGLGPSNVDGWHAQILCLNQGVLFINHDDNFSSIQVKIKACIFVWCILRAKLAWSWWSKLCTRTPIYLHTTIPTQFYLKLLTCSQWHVYYRYM